MTQDDWIAALDSPSPATRWEAYLELSRSIRAAASFAKGFTPISLGLHWAEGIRTQPGATSLAAVLKTVTTVASLPTLLETTERSGFVHTVARSTIRRWLEEAADDEAAEGASICVLWAAQSRDEHLAEFVCDLICKRAAIRPHSTLRAVLPILQQIANQRRLQHLRRGLGAFRALQQDKPFGETYTALTKLLPLSDFPIPSENRADANVLPIPSHDAELCPGDLPAPTSGPETNR